MNDYRTSDVGLNLIMAFEGKPRLKARRCEGGKWELSYGCTFWPDGRPVREGQTITSDQAPAMFVHALKIFEDTVRRHVKVPISQHQFDGLVALVYNIGEEQFATGPDAPCTALRETNAGRFEDAANGFGLWVKATSAYDDNGERYRDPQGNIEDAKGEPVVYRRAFLGLLRRHYAEACVYSGYEWYDATTVDALFIRVDRQWEAERNRWHDRVTSKTPFADVLAVARNRPLAPAAEPKPSPTITIITDKPKEAVSPPPKPDVAVLSDTVETPAVDLSPPANVEAAPVIQPPSPPGPPTISDDTGTTVRADSGAGAAGKPPSIETSAAPTLPPVVVAPPPRPPAPPVPIGQQTSAVNAANNSQDWSAGAKSMLLSRRFYGLLLVVIGRLWMAKTGSNALLSGVSDPIVTEMFSGFAVMIAGELIEWWGKSRATRPLK